MSWFISKRTAFLVIAAVLVEHLAYSRWQIFPLAYPVFAVYLVVVSQIKSFRQAITVGVLATMVAGFSAFHWITFVLSEMGGFPWIVSAFLHSLFNLICLPNFNAFFLLAFLVWPQVERISPWLRPIFWTCLWVGLEFLIRPMKIFPEMVGNTQLPWLELSQLAAYGGVAAISCFVVFFGFALYYAWRPETRRVGLAQLGLWLVLGICIHVWGSYRMARIAGWPAEWIHVEMVQANIGNTDKAVAISGSIGGIQSVLKQYEDLTAVAAAKKPDLILWPETAFPIPFPTDENHRAHRIAFDARARMTTAAKSLGYSIMVGGYEQKPNFNNGETIEFNSGILLGAEGEVQGSYKKNHLMVFGEYMPLADIWPSLKKLNPVMGDFGHGIGPVPVVWRREGKPEIRLGANICYEALIMPFMRELARNGSEIYINFTNDSWFGAGNEPFQHLMLAAHRTIENGLAMVRTTNTGFSLLMDASGQTLAQGPLYEVAIVGGKVPVYNPPIETFYRRHGELFAWLLVLAASLSWTGLYWRGRRPV